jgi:aspartyl-tRNA synthetase
VRAVPAPRAAAQPRSFFDKLTDWARQDMRAAGLGYIVFEAQGGSVEGKGPIAKFIPADVQARIMAKAGLRAGDAVFFAADQPGGAEKLAGAARTRIADELGLIDRERFELCWIVDFPMYEWSEEEQRVDFSHNPFSMPNMAVDEFLALDPADREKILSIKAIQYDIVCNGVELSSGAIRNHRPDVMRKAFAIAGYGENALEQRFGGMLRALSLGAPPHGGIAPGIDRIVMLLCGEENLREVVLFPMNQRAEDLMMGAPSEVAPKQLRELHIRLNLPEKAG